MFLDTYFSFCLIVIRYKHSNWNLEQWESLSCMKLGPFSIGNSISSPLEVGLWWFKIFWKEEKKISNFVVGHFFQFLSLQGEKGETRLKLHFVSDAIKSNLSLVFHLYLELLNSNLGGFYCVGKLIQRSTIAISTSEGKFQLFWPLQSLEVCKKVSAIKQPCYSAATTL